MNQKTICIALIAVLMSGCASYKPVVDMKGVSQSVYDEDLKDCQALAKERDPAAQAAGGAIAGALFGALLGVAVGGSSSYAGYGAGIGAVQGAGLGVAHGAGSQVGIIKNCMAGRGYRVLN